jgi:CubicO group peptidase (beta-lactamase class C family)
MCRTWGNGYRHPPTIAPVSPNAKRQTPTPIMPIRPKPYFPTAGWLEDFPQRHALDGARLLALRPHIEERLPHVRSVLVARHGYVVFELYRQGFGRDSLLNLASVTKSVSAVLTGIAIARGKFALDDRVMAIAPDALDTGDARQSALTVRHVLTMTAGFDWSDAAVAPWRAAADQPRFPLRTPMNAEPGARFNYDTPASHLLSIVLQRATGQTLADFARDALFAPLGITRFEWESDAQGYTYAGHGLSLTSRDALKIGQVCLRGGAWDGAQIVPSDWIDAMLAPHSAGYPDSFGAYGFLWWIQPVRGFNVPYAAGSGGQYLHVVRELDLLVLVTSNHDRLHAENKQIIRDFVLPAVVEEARA